MQQSHPMPRLSLCIGMMVLSQPQGTVQTVNCYLFFLHFRRNPKKRYIQLELIFFKTKRVLHDMLIRLKSNACDFFSYCPACVHVRVPASTTEPQDTLKTVAYITGKKIQQSKNFLLVFPLKISLQTSVCMHQVFLN